MASVLRVMIMSHNNQQVIAYWNIATLSNTSKNKRMINVIKNTLVNKCMNIFTLMSVRKNLAFSVALLTEE